MNTSTHAVGAWQPTSTALVNNQSSHVKQCSAKPSLHSTHLPLLLDLLVTDRLLLSFILADLVAEVEGVPGLCVKVPEMCRLCGTHHLYMVYDHTYKSIDVSGAVRFAVVKHPARQQPMQAGWNSRRTRHRSAWVVHASQPIAPQHPACRAAMHTGRPSACCRMHAK